MTRLVGRQKITSAEAGVMRERFAAWGGASGDFVAAEAQRYGVNRETIRRILRHETHTGVAGCAVAEQPPAFPWAGEVAEASPPGAVEADAARLLASLQTVGSDEIVDVFRDALREPKEPQS